jgi:hypothetical protein
MRIIDMQIAGALALACLVLAGCGNRPPTKVLFGSVTCGGEKVPLGDVRFVPIENGRGAVCGGPVVDGQYRIEACGGVPLGKHRVYVVARKKTGRRIEKSNGREVTAVDEEIQMGPKIYAGDQSPLVVDVRSDFDGQYDIVIPRQ